MKVMRVNRDCHIMFIAIQMNNTNHYCVWNKVKTSDCEAETILAIKLSKSILSPRDNKENLYVE